LRLHFTSDSVLLLYTWGRGREIHDTLALRAGGTRNRVRINDRVWPSNVFMGVSLIPGSEKEVVARVHDSVLTLEERYPVAVSQGEGAVRSTATIRLAADGECISYTVARSTRPKETPLSYILKREGLNGAYVMQIEDEWEVTGKLPLQALLLSLQGLANTDSARLYFLYPPNWPFTFTQSVYDFYRTRRNFTFTKLNSAEEALKRLGACARGYVIWDRNVRTSLGVAFTIAGLERALVVDDSLAPLAERAGLKQVADLRGRFGGKSDAEIYAWAWREYGARCNKELIVWLGGEAGRVMKPSIADYGISRRAFFTDLSARPSDTAEYALADRILDGMHPTAVVMGWHSYAKDLEEEFVTLTSRHGLVVEGLNTLPNNSFSAHVPLSRGFVFRNNHHLKPARTPAPADKVYISCIQTDGMGLGAWLEPGRGTIPYAWEVTMNWVWMAPAMLEYFYTMATPNDYLIGCLSGPGYMYPKAVPPALLPGLIARAYTMMKQLDLNVFEIMDYSEGRTVEGNTELAKNVVQAYFDGMPGVVGFVNGYAPGFTFT
ncbi:MAG TPA: GxGYxYP domain-containing protein, partial [Bacteroidota bacterium]